MNQRQEGAEGSIVLVTAVGGGFALVMDPIKASSLLAPLVVAMDLYALRFWRPHTWSRPDLALLVPGLQVGVATGYLVLRHVDRHLVEVLMAVTTLLFAFLWWRGKSGAVRVLVQHGDDDQIVPYADSGPLSAKLLPHGMLKTYERFPHRMPTTQADVINADILAFIKG